MSSGDRATMEIATTTVEWFSELLSYKAMNLLFLFSLNQFIRETGLSYFFSSLHS
jgi:hypothetical protein